MAKTKKNPVAVERREMPQELWDEVLQLPQYDGIYALISTESDNIYQNNNPNILEEQAHELGWQEYWIIDLLGKDYRENIPERNWELFEKYSDWQTGQKILKDFHGSISDALMEDRGRAKP